MRGFQYLLVVLVAVLGLSLAARLVYSRYPVTSEVATTPAAPPAAAAESKTTIPSLPSPPKQPEEEPATRQAASAAKPMQPAPRPGARTRATTRSSAAATPAPDAPAPAEISHGKEQPPADRPAPATESVAAPPVWQATPRELVRDSAYVMTSSGRLQAAIAVLDAWVRDHPTDSAVAIDLARLRARAGDWAGSIAQYTTLMEQHRTAQLLFERGQTYLWAGDTRRGEADLLASEAMSPRAETQRQLGDHYRWQGDLARSASWYRLALRNAPGDTAVLNSMRLLDRAVDARLLLPGELAGSDFGSGAQVISDNAGFDLSSLRLSQAFGVPMGSSTVLTLSGEVRSASRMSLGGSENQLEAYGVDASVSTRAGTSKLTAAVGMLDHGSLPSVVRGSFTADGFLGSARLRASVRRAPAYETLWAPRMLGVAGSPSTTLATQGNLSLPIGSWGELYATGEFLSVSDDNSRTAFQLALRRRLPGWLSLGYAGSLMAYDRQTSLYYSPARYFSQSLGIELARYREQGLSFALRATPGYAWMREPAGTADSTTRDLSAFQFATGVELGYRRGAWDLLLSTGLSSGREGGYRSQNALLYVRRSWQ
jgi:hypothetical protein